MILQDAGIDKGGFGAADGASQQLPVLHEAAGFYGMILHDAGKDQGRWSGAKGPTLSWRLNVRSRLVGAQWWGKVGDSL